MSASTDPAAVAHLEARIATELDVGNVLAAQFAIGLGGEIVASGSFGEALDDTRFCIFSATKALVSSTLIPFIASGALDPEATVASYIPEFGTNGKDVVTVEQLTTMRGGFPMAPMGPKYWATSAGRRSGFARWRLDYEPGTRCIYHPMAAHWVQAELIETLSGKPYVDQVHETITAPLGLAPALGPTVGELPIHDVRIHGERPDDAAMLATFGDARYVPLPAIGVDALLALNAPDVRLSGVPGGGGFLRATDLATIYQGLLNNPAGVFPEAALDDARSNIRNQLLDELSGVSASRTLMYCTAGDDGHADLRSFPSTAPRAFGHMGAGGQIAWGDPDTGLSFVFLNDTLHQDPRVEYLRARDLNALAMACLSTVS